VMFPGKYNSDFAVQVTSAVPDAQRPQYISNICSPPCSGLPISFPLRGSYVAHSLMWRPARFVDDCRNRVMLNAT
jgi:hypothetical protein